VSPNRCQHFLKPMGFGTALARWSAQRLGHYWVERQAISVEATRPWGAWRHDHHWVCNLGRSMPSLRLGVGVVSLSNKGLPDHPLLVFTDLVRNVFVGLAGVPLIAILASILPALWLGRTSLGFWGATQAKREV